MSPDPYSSPSRFAPVPAHQLARQLGAKLEGDPARPIISPARLGTATADQVSFLAASAADSDISSTCAGAVVVDESCLATARERLPDEVRLVVADAHAAFLEILALFHPSPPRATCGISERACVGDELAIGEATNIHPGATIGDRVTLGDRCDVHPGAVIGNDCQLGDDVVIHPGTVIYSETTFTPTDDTPGGKFIKIQHYGSVLLEDDVEIGAGTTIDRGMIDATVIGTGTKIDDQVMVGHNCHIGPHNAFASQVGIAGSTSTGAYVRFGGQVGVADHLTIGTGASVGAKAAVARSIPDGETQLGYPAGPESEQLRILIAQKRLPELLKTVKKLVKRIDQLEAQRDNNPDSQQPPQIDPQAA